MEHLHFGFSYVGLIFLLMLFIPNFIWTKYKPQGYEESLKKENKVLVLFERIGEFSVTVLVLIFDDFNIHTINLWSLFLFVAILCMGVYELYWIRYFKSERKLSDFYADFLKIPAPGAVLPVLAFFLLGLYGKNIFLLLATLILGIGHIGIHLLHRRECKNKEI